MQVCNSLGIQQLIAGAAVYLIKKILYLKAERDSLTLHNRVTATAYHVDDL